MINERIRRMFSISMQQQRDNQRQNVLPLKQPENKSLNPTGIYILTFDDKKYRVAACRNIDDVQSMLVHQYPQSQWAHRHEEHKTFHRIDPQYKYIRDNFAGAVVAHTIVEAIARAEEIQKNKYPGVPIIFYPGMYEPPLTSVRGYCG